MPTLEGKRLLGALEAYLQTPEGSRDQEVRNAAQKLSEGLRKPAEVEGQPTPGQRAVAEVTNHTPSREVISPMNIDSDELSPGDKAILDASSELV
jgi:hypothetical protein